MTNGEVAILEVSADFKTVSLKGIRHTAPPKPRDAKAARKWEEGLKTKQLKAWKVAEEVQDIKHSPDGQYLAAGSRDNNIHIFSVQRKYTRVAIFEATAVS